MIQLIVDSWYTHQTPTEFHFILPGSQVLDKLQSFFALKLHLIQNSIQDPDLRIRFYLYDQFILTYTGEF